MGARAALLSLLLALAASAPLPFAPGRVLQLSLDSFDAELARGPYLVYVGTEWCSHCQRLKPHFAEAALALQGHTACAFVDASAERVLQTRLGVRGYPSVFLFRDGAMRSYSGARTASALVAWARAGYADTPVAPFHKTPNNALGRLLGRVLRLPAAAARGWEYARAASGMGEASLAACAALAALLAAAAAVLGLDALVQLSVRAPAPHAHAA